jgi:DNA-binding MarR family transcriptional regulator
MSRARDRTAEINDLMQEVIASSVLTNERIARRFGLNVVDGQTLGVLARAGIPLTPGEIGSRVSLPSSTVTRVVDRLEGAGFVRRVPDPEDRRRVRVEPVPGRLAELASSYDGLSSALRRHNEAFDDAELDVVIRYMRGMIAATADVGD